MLEKNIKMKQKVMKCDQILRKQPNNTVIDAFYCVNVNDCCPFKVISLFLFSTLLYENHSLETKFCLHTQFIKNIRIDKYFAHIRPPNFPDLDTLIIHEDIYAPRIVHNVLKLMTLHLNTKTANSNDFIQYVINLNFI